MGLLIYNEVTDTITNIMEASIYEAFKDVELGDGIGYFEADCIDDYLKPDDPFYQIKKAEDERKDWRKVATMLKAWNGKYNKSINCFMDAKGLYFFLPAMLTLGYVDEIVEYWFNYLIENNCKIDYSKYDKMLAMLTPTQQKCFLDCIEQDFEYEERMDNLLNYKGCVCSNCGKIHEPESYTMEQAKEEIESEDYFKIWMKLKEIFAENEKNKITEN